MYNTLLILAFASFFTTTSFASADLISAEISTVKGDVYLDWSTENEVESNYYLIERSLDQINWFQIHKEGVNPRMVYEYNDLNVSTDKTYYYKITEVSNSGVKTELAILSIYVPKFSTVMGQQDAELNLDPSNDFDSETTPSPDASDGKRNFTGTTSFRSIKTYPNPANEQLFIESDMEMSNVHITLSDMEGNILISKENNFTKRLVLELSEFEKGFYILTMTDGKNSKTQRIVIDK